MSRTIPDMAVLLLRNRKRTDELYRQEGLDGRAHKSGAVTRDDKVHAGTLGHRTDTAVLKVRLIGIGGGKTSLLVERLYRVALKAVAHYLAPARLAGLSSGLSTRLGAALRHAGAEIARVRSFLGLSASAELDGLFDSGSRAWTFAPVLSLPIFDGGRRRANLALSEVREDIAVAEYEKSIQTAFREVADALAARRWLGEQRDVQRVALDAAAERARLAQLRYDHGSAAYLEVLDAQRDLLAAEQQLVQARRALLSSQVGLYAALGGGSGAEPAALPATLPATPADPPNS